MKTEITTPRYISRLSKRRHVWNSLVGGHDCAYDTPDIFCVLDCFGKSHEYLIPKAIDLHFALLKVFGCVYPYYLSNVISNFRDLEVILEKFPIDDIVETVLYYSDCPVGYSAGPKSIDVRHYLKFQKTIVFP